MSFRFRQTHRWKQAKQEPAAQSGGGGGSLMVRATISRYPFSAPIKFLSEKISMPQRLGRPRVNLEKKILADMAEHEKQLEAIVAEKIDFKRPSILTFEAACLVLEIERGADPRTVQGTAIFRTINQCARAHGPHGKWRGARDFLEEFIQHYAPNWNWREEARIGEVEARNYKTENERIAKEHAEDARSGMACATKFYTPDAPDPVLLCALAWEVRHKKPSTEEFKRFGWSAWKHWTVIRETWPTLRELKLATAIPERVLTRIIKNLRPQKNEMTKEPRIVPRIFDASRREFSRRGAVPLRYGPRLVICVLNEFLNRLPEFSMDDEERKRLRKMALRVKRAFVARLTHSRSST